MLANNIKKPKIFHDQLVYDDDDYDYDYSIVAEIVRTFKFTLSI